MSVLALSATARADEPSVAPEPWGLEVSGGLGVGVDRDAYLERLMQFGYVHGELSGLMATYDVVVSWRARHNLELVADLAGLGGGDYRRDDTVPTTFTWESHAASAFVRFVAPANDERAALFAEVGAGFAWVTSDYSKGPDAHDQETQLGEALAVGVGARAAVGPALGVVFDLRHTYAPILHNLYGDRHDVGGTTVTIGLRFSF